jgi:hypothetical protein
MILAIFVSKLTSGVPKYNMCNFRAYTKFIEVKESFRFRTPKLSQTVCEMEILCLHLLTVFYVTQPSNKSNGFDFEMAHSERQPILLYVF